MKKIYGIWMMVLFVLVAGRALAQSGMDTLELVETAADTVVANQYLGEIKALIKEKKWEAAEAKADQARRIYTRVFGEECKQVADVWHQVGSIGYRQVNYDKAIQNWEKALEIRLKVLAPDHRDLIRSYNNLGGVYFDQGQYDKSIECAQKSLAILLKTLGPDHPEVANSYNILGVLFYIKKEYDKSIENHQKSLDILFKIKGPDHTEVATSYQNIGNSFNSKGSYDKAMEHHQKALEIRLKVLGPDHPDVATSYQNIGSLFNSKGTYHKAMEYHQKALEIRLKVLGPDHPDVATSYYNLGILFRLKGAYDEAIECDQNFLEISLKTLGPMHLDVAACYTNLGNSFQSKGEYDKAIEYCQKDLEIRLKILGAEHSDVATSYNNMGNSFRAKGAYDKAIDYHQKALEIRLKNLGLEDPDIANSYNNLGNSYNDKGAYEKAIGYHQKAMAIFLKALGPEHSSVAASYTNLGNSYDGKKEYEKAIEYHQKASEIFLKVLGPEHPNVALSYSNMANSYNGRGEYSKAIEHYQKALEIMLKVLGLEHPDVANSYNNLGHAFKSQGNSLQALNCYRQALAACGYTNGKLEEVNSLEQLHKALNSLSYTLAAQYGQSRSQDILDQSQEYIFQAIAALDYQQFTFSEESSKTFWQNRNYPVYEQAIAVSLIKADADHIDSLRQNAFTYTEKSKSAQLRAQTRSAEAAAFAGVPDALLQHEYDFRSDIGWREKQRQGLLENGLAETDTNVLRISSIIFDLKQSVDSLTQLFKVNYPDYYRLKYDLSTVSLDYVQDTLLQKNQTLLEYFVGDSAVYIFTVRPDTFNVTEIKKDFPLEDWVTHLRHGIYDYYQSGSADPVYYDSTAGEYARAAYQIYSKLVAPVADLLTDQVIVVPDGALGYVPFEALLTKQPTVPRRFYNHSYFGKERRISYAYSATLLREMQDKKHKTEPTGSLLALAPFSRDDVKVLREQLDTLSELIALRSDTLTTLRHSGREALVAEKMFKGQALLGIAATKDTFQQLAGRYRILHLGTHGKANDKIGEYAYLGFGLSGNTSGFDKLYVKDIYNLSLNADLVVLSACETGIGQLQRGEGIISLARAFAYAGAKSIVTTLWKVDDARTGRLVQGFYKNLRKDMAKDEALWRVKREVFMESKTDAHPFFWAGFIPIGDMRAIKN